MQNLSGTELRLTYVLAFQGYALPFCTLLSPKTFTDRGLNSDPQQDRQGLYFGNTATVKP